MRLYQVPDFTEGVLICSMIWKLLELQQKWTDGFCSKTSEWDF